MLRGPDHIAMRTGACIAGLSDCVGKMLGHREKVGCGEKTSWRWFPLFCYAASKSAAVAIADIPARLGASRLILGAPRRNALINILRGKSRPGSFRLVAGGNRPPCLRKT